MLLVALFSMVFGTIVDRTASTGDGALEPRHPDGLPDRRRALPRAARVRAARHRRAVVLAVLRHHPLRRPSIENMRNIALSTTVTLLVPVERHANANGLVGTVQGIAFIVTSVFSGLAIGLLGMGWTLVIAIVFTLAGARAPRCFLRIPEDTPARDGDRQPDHRLPRQRPGDQVGARAVRADHLRDLQQPHRRRLHGADGPVRPDAVPRRMVGRGPRRHVDRVHHRRHVDREVRARPQPDPHDAALRHRDGRARQPLHDPGVVVALRARASGSTWHHPGRRGIRADRHPEGRALRDAGSRLRLRRRRSSRRPRRSRHSSSRPSRSSGSSPTWTRRPASRRGDGSSATARRAASRWCSSSAGSSWWSSRCSPSRRASYRTLSEEYQRAPETAEGDAVDRRCRADRRDGVRRTTRSREARRARRPLSGRIAATRAAWLESGHARRSSLTADTVAAALREHPPPRSGARPMPARLRRLRARRRRVGGVPPAARRRAGGDDRRRRRRRAVRRATRDCSVVARGAGTGLSGGANALEERDRRLARAHDARARDRRRRAVRRRRGRDHQRRPAPGGRRRTASGIRPTRRATGSRRSAATSPRTPAASAASSTA